VLNVAGDAVIRNAEKIVRSVGTWESEDPPYKQSSSGDILKLVAKSSRARDHLGFEPKVPLDEGLLEVWRRFKEKSIPKSL
jgi:nucleoside-diphosphate-sugar epimerase